GVAAGCWGSPCRASCTIASPTAAGPSTLSIRRSPASWWSIPRSRSCWRCCVRRKSAPRITPARAERPMPEKVTHHTAPQWSVCKAQTVTEFVHGHLTRLPDQPLLIYEDGVVVKRGELLEQSERFAAFLADPVKTGGPVAIMIGNRQEYFIALYATIANRAILVSLNPDAKEHDAGYVLRDSGAMLVICGAEHRPLMEKLRGECP